MFDYLMFIEVSKGGRCSCVRSFNPYSTIVEEEKMKYARPSEHLLLSDDRL